MADDLVARFVWTVKNFDMCPHLTGEPLYSSNFCIGSYEFNLILYPRGDDDPNYIAIYIERLDDWGAEKILVTNNVRIVGENKSSHKQSEMYEKEKYWGWNQYIKREKLLTADRCIFLPDNNLTVICDVFSLSVQEENSKRLSDAQDAEILSSDFAEILRSGIHSDIVLVVEGSKFNAHRAIFQCRCPQLLSCLEQTENANEYDLFGISASVFRAVLHYLYTGVLSVTNMDKDVLDASGKFNVSGLRQSLTAPYSKTIHAITEIPISHLSFEWTIPNFSKFQLMQELVYPVYCVATDDWSNIEIILTKVKNKIGLTEIRLKFKNTDNYTVPFIRCKISICKQLSGCHDPTGKEYENIMLPDEDWIIPLVSQTEFGEVLSNDTLNMNFELFMSVDKKETSKIQKVSVKNKTGKVEGEVVKNLRQFQTDFLKLYINAESKSTDITLHVADKKYNVHKFILSARSKIFAKMFENTTLVKEEGVIIEDTDAETLWSVLLYIYAGHIDEMDISKAKNLYMAADKYELFTLKDKCANFLNTSLDADHIGEILLFAEAHHDASIKRCVYDYMKINPKKVLESADGLTVLESRMDLYPGIVKVLLEYISSKD